MHGWMTPDHVSKSTGPRTESENDTRNPIQSTTCPTATCPPITAPPQNRRIPMFCLLHGNQSPPNSRPGHPDHGLNRGMKAEDRSSPHRHRATNHSTTTKPRNTNNLINTRRTATGTPATQPTKSADRTANHTTTSEPVHTDAHQHRATNHDTTTKPRNTNNPHTPR